MARTAVILGGGVGGVVAARRLRRLLPRTDQVVLIDREPDHVFQPSLLWLAIGARRPAQIRRPLTRLARYGIDVLHRAVDRIDPLTRRVGMGPLELTADALVISLGAELNPDLIPGLAASGHNLYTVAGASAIRDALRAFTGGRIAVLTAAPAYKCPAAPYEASLLIEDELRRRGVRERTTMDMYAAEPGPMGVAGPAVSAAVRALIEHRGIRYHPGQQVTRVDPEARRLEFSNTTTADFDLLIYIPPHQAPAVVRAAGLTGESGWIMPDRRTFETARPGVFAIGDVTSVPLTMGKPLPKAGVFAHAQAEVVAANIAAGWAGRSPRRVFDGHGKCFLETGGGKAGIGAGNFYAEPAPAVVLQAPGRLRHWLKVLFEQWWLRRWF